MAEFYEVLAGRRSVRRFRPDPVPEAEVREIVRWATLAPSASNRQMWKFVAVADAGVKAAMREAVERAIDELARAVPGVKGVGGMKGWSFFFADAPVVIAVFGEEYRSRTDDALKARGLAAAEIDRLRARPDLQSIGAAVQTLLLAAHAKGYGTCWMCAPVLAAREIERLLGVEERWRLVALVPLGVPAERPKSPGRKRLEEVFTYLGGPREG
ncbi:MAG: nitroreductase family protein [Bacillota bacterium]|nr:nitroreductase family protein [Bacillota bacterium]